MALTAAEEALWRHALAADKAFQARLVQLYKGRAGDMRYQSSRWTDRVLKALSIRSQRANERWLKAFKAANLRTANPMRRAGSYPKGRTPPHLKQYLFKKGRAPRTGHR